MKKNNSFGVNLAVSIKLTLPIPLCDVSVYSEENLRSVIDK